MFFILLIGYSIFLKLFPLKKTVFYTNEERVEEFAYSKDNFPIVLVGSSLSGAFESYRLFNQPYFNLFLPNTGAATGIDIVKRTNKIPRKLFIEINHIDRGVDSNLMHEIFDEPLYTIKYDLPFLLKKNQLIPNLIDRVKTPHNNIINAQQPPPVLYNALLLKAQEEWKKLPDTVKFNQQLAHIKAVLNLFSSKGCRIYFYEMPMDHNLYHSPLLTYQRNYFSRLAAEKGYTFIKCDTSRNYLTGDGDHLLSNDGAIYVKYFESQKLQ
jgi:hypothetical protein